ncbi:hypothetical protein Ancab_026460 [Ancistrocladus abbreviatus]
MPEVIFCLTKLSVNGPFSSLRVTWQSNFQEQPRRLNPCAHLSLALKPLRTPLSLSLALNPRQITLKTPHSFATPPAAPSDSSFSLRLIPSKLPNLIVSICKKLLLEKRPLREEMGSKSLVGKEVPIVGSDSVKWVEVSVPLSYAVAPGSPPVASLTEDAASCSVIGKPPTYLIWRIRKNNPHAIEVLQLCAQKEFQRIGLRILFPESLSPFAYICKNEINATSGNPYLLYVLSVSGIAYLFQIKDVSKYATSAVFHPNEILCFGIQNSPEYGPITAVTAMDGCLVIGRDDGSIAYFRLGSLDQDDPAFMHELRDEATFSRLWGFMSRARTAGSVKDVVMSDVQGRKVVFVLHSDGTLRVWDLLGHGKIFSHSVNIPGTTVVRLWVGEVNHEASAIYLAVLHRQNLEVNVEGIYIYSINFAIGDKIFLESSVQCIPLTEGELIDVKLALNKIWVLKEGGLLVQNLLCLNGNVEQQYYALQEAFVADQLFQSSKHSLDHLFQITCSIFSSAKAQIIAFVSSIFLNRLLHPGVHISTVLRVILEDYNKRWTDAEFQTLTVDDLKREILLLIEHEFVFLWKAVSGNTFSVLKCWRDLYKRYFECWLKSNSPYGLLVDSLNGAVGLIRENSLSLFRNLEEIELLVYGTFGEVVDFLKLGSHISSDGLEREILFEVLHCSSLFSQHFGRAMAPIFYQSVFNVPMIPTDDVVLHLLKTLESGHASSLAAVEESELGADLAQYKENADHKSLRRFSVDMLVTLRTLCNKSAGWDEVLNAIERYLKFLVPQKILQDLDSERVFSINTCVVIQATSQVAKVMFESALDILLLLSYLLKISGQIQMSHLDVSRVQLELIPMIQETVAEWVLIYFLGTTPTESPAMEDFSSQLSSLRIDSNGDKRSWTERLGSINFTLDFVLTLSSRGSFEDQNRQSSSSFPSPQNFVSLVQSYISWLIWGGPGETSSYIFGRSIELAHILLRHGQYNAVESILKIVDAHLRNEKLSESVQRTDGEWCLLHHLLGCCLTAQAHGGLRGPSKEKKISEAVRCFFRASSGKGADHALRSFPCEAGLQHLVTVDGVSPAAWRLQYYQWVMQLFERYNFSEAACQFALAALEQVDEAVVLNSNGSGPDLLNESVSTVKGRLWANVFKLTLDLSQYHDAYCAIITNPDEESKCICLRRFIIVLYERDATKILCNNELPFIGLAEKVERELAWKAARSDMSMKPNPYKLLYAFEMQQQNWRKAASYIYLYSAELRNEVALRNYQNPSLAFQERLNGISAAINALHLVHPTYAWIDLQIGGNHLHNESHPSKKARMVEDQSGNHSVQPERQQSFVDIQKLEDEFVLTSAEYLLSLANMKWMRTGNEKFPSDLVDLLVETDIYDMVFTVLIRFWKGSGLKRELERVFSAMSLKCCLSYDSSPGLGSNSLLLTSSKDEAIANGALDVYPSRQSNKSRQWELLELYLERYKVFHARLPVVVAETLLHSDAQIELPRWLVHMFKGGRPEKAWGMTGQECDPASLFRLYVRYGRYTEATDLLVEYIEAYASVRPADIMHRKRPFSAWFPYTAIERLWCQLEESIRLGHMVEQCEKLKNILLGALRSHLHLLKKDSEDALSSVN